MTKWIATAVIVLGFAAAPCSSKDKTPKVSYQQMVLGMRDAFDCGVVVEQYLHGRLKGNEDAYHKERAKYNCDYVEAVLTKASEQDKAAAEDQQ